MQDATRYFYLLERLRLLKSRTSFERFILGLANLLIFFCDFQEIHARKMRPINIHSEYEMIHSNES